MLQRLAPQSEQRGQKQDRTGSERGSVNQEKAIDLEYLVLREEVAASRFLLYASKHHRVRVEGWLQRLDEMTANMLWKRNRNNYAKLLHLMCDCQNIVEPFHVLPPQGDLPQLTKLQINHIIDEVEKMVKMEAERPQAKVSLEDSCSEIPHSSSIRQQELIISEEEEAKQDCTEDEQSLVIGRFVNFPSRREQPSNTAYFSVMEQSKESQNSPQKKTCSTQVKSKAAPHLQSRRDTKENLFQKEGAGTKLEKQKAPKHLVVKINIHHPVKNQTTSVQPLEESQENLSASCFTDMDECLDQSRSSSTSQNPQIPTQFQNQTLKTELFDQDLPISSQNMNDFSQISLEECDFNSQLSQRCRERDQVPSNYSYFAWKLQKEVPPPCQKDKAFHKQKIALTESIPSKGLVLRASTKANIIENPSSMRNSAKIQEELLQYPHESSRSSELSMASELEQYSFMLLQSIANNHTT